MCLLSKIEPGRLLSLGMVFLLCALVLGRLPFETHFFAGFFYALSLVFLLYGARQRRRGRTEKKSG